jgi:hypothetical protein
MRLGAHLARIAALLVAEDMKGTGTTMSLLVA